MEKQFLITESHKKFGVVNLWNIAAKDLNDMANQIIENDEDFRELLTGLGGEEWDVTHRRYVCPMPQAVLEAIDASFGESSYYQIFEVPKSQTEGFKAIEQEALPAN